MQLQHDDHDWPVYELRKQCSHASNQQSMGMQLFLAGKSVSEKDQTGVFVFSPSILHWLLGTVKVAK